MHNYVQQWCDDIGVPYQDHYNPEQIAAAYHTAKKLGQLFAKFNPDMTDDVFFGHRLHNDNTLSIVMRDYAIEFRDADLIAMKAQMSRAQSLSVTKTKDDMVEMMIVFSLV